MKKRWFTVLFLLVLLCTANERPVEDYLPGNDCLETIGLEYN